MEQQQHILEASNERTEREALRSVADATDTAPAAVDTASADRDAPARQPARPRDNAHRRYARTMLIRLCATAVMIALAVILCRLLGFPQSGIWRVEISFLPIAFVAFLWGPVWAGAAYGTADLIGAAIFTGVNPFITLEKLFSGVVMGIFFHRRSSRRTRIGVGRTLLAFLVIAVLGDFAMMAFIFKFAFGYTWGAALAFRGVNASVNLVIRCCLMCLCDLRLTARLLREGEKYGV